MSIRPELPGELPASGCSMSCCQVSVLGQAGEDPSFRGRSASMSRDAGLSKKHVLGPQIL